jgi:PncC family amidohydrolase
MNSETLEVTVGKLLLARGLTLALAESCTGGLVSHRLTEVAGSSDYFRGAVVAYANEVKRQLLGVRQGTLDVHGAVSAETALEMARGARRALGTDVGLSVTGIAGPGGGKPGKPVGLVFVALAADDDERCERHVWKSDRSGNKILSSQAVLELLRSYLEGK